MKRFFVAALAVMVLCLPQTIQAKVTHLLPKPQHVELKSGAAPFSLNRNVTVSYSGGADKCELLEEFFTQNGCTITNGGATVNVTLVSEIEGAYDYTLEGYENEAYSLEISENAIEIKAITATGIIRAAQTLTQLAEGYPAGSEELEALSMTDWPAFKLRGYMHDVGRSFIEFETLKKHIDLLARFKVNTFHWHMTENQAWRFEVKAYPQLTSSASMTRFAGKYYTQEQCRELQDYAKERGVIVIPEIDMPGHSQAFKTAMGHSMQSDQGVAELQVILEEVAAVFPDAPYIHIGADEETIEYPNFLKIMTDKVHSLGKKVVVWNPIRDVTISTSIGADMTQMWSSSGKVINGMPNIDCRYNYTNHFDVFADLVGIYKSNIYYEQKGNANVAGTISAPWNDRKTPTEEDIIIQNNFYANVIASAERAWIGGGKQYIEKGGTTLPNSGEEYEEFADWERRFLFHKANSLKDEPIAYVKQTNVRWRITDPFPNGGDMNASFAPETEGLKESYTVNGTTYGTGIATGAGIYLRHTWGNNTVPTYYGSTNYSNSTAYAWTYVYSDKAQTVGAQIEFQNYGRSEKDTAPDAGKWDRKGSRIWLNDTEILPPTWDNTGVGINNEVDLKNENFTARKPLQVTLKEGWNKVFIKLPYVGASGVRLNKWMFTFVLTDTEGVNAVDGLIYSPNQCMDETTELVAAKISEIKRDRGAYIGTAVGLWPESTAAALDAKVKEIEATYSATMTAEERAAQIAALEEAWIAFTAQLTGDNMNKPVSGHIYRMYTPLRGSRYATGNGTDAAITGPTEATTKASIWRFVARTDGSYNIINLADGTYISPASNNNTALKTVANEPNAGWTIKKADNTGNVIVVSGSAQFNQQKDGNLYLLNWGSGTNTSDGGCQYRLIDVT
ncbi:MAG: family 20 glycosylhydrolase, partial [Bacteroidaceae bacterium]|nr:family 20 glycosylhydrolase [Bacteroidaceae bacterium]